MFLEHIEYHIVNIQVTLVCLDKESCLIHIKQKNLYSTCSTVHSIQQTPSKDSTCQDKYKIHNDHQNPEQQEIINFPRGKSSMYVTVQPFKVNIFGFWSWMKFVHSISGADWLQQCTRSLYAVFFISHIYTHMLRANAVNQTWIILGEVNMGAHIHRKAWRKASTIEL